MRRTVRPRKKPIVDGVEHLLKDGDRVLIRAIEPRDKAELAAGLTKLSDLTVRRRFLAPKTHFTRAELRYLTEVDGHDHAAFVAEVLNDRERRDGFGVPATSVRGRVAAVARWVRLADEPGTAEAAVVVADVLQGNGLGSLLADRLAETAAAEGVRRFTATMLSDNHAARRLMVRLSRDLESRHDGTGHARLIAPIAA